MTETGNPSASGKPAGIKTVIKKEKMRRFTLDRLTYENDQRTVL
jgi:hypothetical protein